MTEKEFADCIRLMRRAPLRDMNEAEAVAQLIQTFSKFAAEHIGYDDGEGIDVPENPGGSA